MDIIAITDITQYEPQITDFGIQEFSAEITRASADVFRDLKIRWWPTQQSGLYDLKILETGRQEPNDNNYDINQLKRACVYQALGFHIYPKLAKFEPGEDIFERKMMFYRKEYERELDLILREGVKYDIDSSGTITNAEKQSESFLRLKR